jgi:hypothetical protein
VTAAAYGVYTHEDTSEPAPGFQQRRSDLAWHKDTYLPLFCNEVRFRPGFGPPLMNVALANYALPSAIGAIPGPTFTFCVRRPLGFSARQCGPCFAHQ